MAIKDLDLLLFLILSSTRVESIPFYVRISLNFSMLLFF